MGRRPNTVTTTNSKTIYLKKVGELLKGFRNKCGVTQQQVADKMKLSTPQYVSNIERGISPPSIEFLRQTSKLYGIPHGVIAASIGSEITNFYLAELR